MPRGNGSKPIQLARSSKSSANIHCFFNTSIYQNQNVTRNLWTCNSQHHLIIHLLKTSVCTGCGNSYKSPEREAARPRFSNGVDKVTRSRSYFREESPHNTVVSHSYANEGWTDATGSGWGSDFMWPKEGYLSQVSFLSQGSLHVERGIPRKKRYPEFLPSDIQLN